MHFESFLKFWNFIQYVKGSKPGGVDHGIVSNIINNSVRILLNIMMVNRFYA
jgi:hypothetical protein